MRPLLRPQQGTRLVRTDRVADALSVRVLPAHGADGGRVAVHLPGHRRLDVRIYDVAGRWVPTLTRDRRDAGWHELVWDARDAYGGPVAAGVYFVRVQTPEMYVSRKLLLLR